MRIAGYSHESCLPCALPQVMLRTARRPLKADSGTRIGLSKDLLAVPLATGGFFLTSGEHALVVDSIDDLGRIDGSRDLADLSTREGMADSLEQLNAHGLLSFDGTSRALRIAGAGDGRQGSYPRAIFANFSVVPLTVEICITNRCHFSCVHCIKRSSPWHDEAGDLSPGELRELIARCGAIGVAAVQLMGGEPLAHPEFFELAQHAKDSGIPTLRVSTNGWLVDERAARMMARFFSSVQVSVHGASASVHDKIVRMPGAFEQARRAVSLLVDQGIRTNLSFTVMAENLPDIDAMERLAREWGVLSLRYLRLIPAGRGRKLCGWSSDDAVRIGATIKEAHDRSEKVHIEAGGFAPLEPISDEASFYGCPAGRTLVSIDSSGGVRPCGSLSDDYVANIRDADLVDIWYSAEFVALRVQPKCAGCDYGSICWGPCLVAV
jgi:radical SAM protein with 4Fe4S-binding SPASM domain